MGWACRKLERSMHRGLQEENMKGRRPLGRCRRRWKDNIKMDLGERCGLDLPRS
jgi:hypothetical protein